MSNFGRQQLALGRYVTVIPTLGNQQEHPLRVNVNGVLMVDATGGSGSLTVQAEGQYNLVPITLADEEFAPLQLDVNGYLRNTEQYAPQYEDNTNAVAATIERPLINSTTYAPDFFSRPAQDSGLASSGVIKAAAATLFAFVAMIQRAEATVGPLYIQFFNRTSAATAGATPVFSFALNFPQFEAAIVDPATDPPCFMDRLQIGREFFSHGGADFSTGLVWGLSSTATTFTAAQTILELHATYK